MSVTAAGGFVAAGVHCGIRRGGRKDLAVVRSVPRATGAAMWTANRLQAAPVVVSREHLELAEPQAVVINSGTANAATGQRGELDARATAAEAILTTNTRPKQAIAHGPGFTVGGMAKGSGMIHPNLATMLAVVTTDFPLEPGEAIDFLRPAVDASFNSISVDGECSTNDAVVLLSSGAAQTERTPATDTVFSAALHKVCADLSGQIVADGEGATMLAEIFITGAASPAEAKAIARRIATSPLVKTALFGRDANWGRILAAAGSAPHNGGFANVDPERVTLDFNGVRVLAGGAPQGGEPKLDGGTCRIELELGLGTGRASYLTSDLSYDYVRINADYRT
jgi:glutamate N-acetyltransferase / amino-acid N-acetyltransferase